MKLESVMRNRLLSLAAGAVLAAASAAAWAEEPQEGVDDTPSAGSMAFDLVIVRPVSLLATVLGAGLFVVSIPFDAISGKGLEPAARRLVVEPAKYTFVRPLGQTD